MHGNINAQTASRRRSDRSPIAPRRCVPLDVFGTPGSITPAMLDFIGFDQHDTSEQKIWGASANISGKLVRLSAAGRSASPPASNIAASRAGSIPIRSSRPASAPTFRRRRRAAATRSPKSMPSSTRPSSRAVRAPSCSSSTARAATRTTRPIRADLLARVFKTDLNWKPVDAIRLRASYAEGFRAPTIGELEGGPSRFDSHDRRSVLDQQPPDAQLQQRCDGPRQLHRRRAFPPQVASTAPADQLSVVTGGNEELKPETSTQLHPRRGRQPASAGSRPR